MAAKYGCNMLGVFLLQLAPPRLFNGLDTRPYIIDPRLLLDANATNADVNANAINVNATNATNAANANANASGADVNANANTLECY